MREKATIIPPELGYTAYLLGKVADSYVHGESYFVKWTLKGMHSAGA